MNIPLPVLGSWFAWYDRSVLLTTNTPPTQVLPPNPNRWCIVWQNAGTGTQAINFVPNMGVSGGFYLLLTTLPFTMPFSTYGGMVQDAWYATGNPVGQFINIWEIVYMPPAMSEAGVDTGE